MTTVFHKRSYSPTKWSLLPSWLPQSSWTSTRRGGRPRWMVGLWILGLTALTVDRFMAYRVNSKPLIMVPIYNMEGSCPKQLEYPVLSQSTLFPTEKPNICLTTLTDAKRGGNILHKLLRWRNFDALLGLTLPNKMAYGLKHGYFVYDGSDALEPNRPPSWSKIRAVQQLLQQKEPACDWVVWLDADTLIMNSNIRLEDILPADPEKHLVITAQKGGSYNAGAWMVRNSPWTRQFLDTWWNMKEFVQPPGLATSGDNAALKSLLLGMNSTEFQQHIVVPERCTFNADAAWFTPQQAKMYQEAVEHGEGMDFLQGKGSYSTGVVFHKNNGKYHKGDFVVHVAGIDNKELGVKLFLPYVS